MNDPINAEQAHQVAMEAAYAVHQCAIHRGDIEYDDIGTKCAKAYLQAYEAVEGWTKPKSKPEVNYAIPHVSLNYGESVNLFNVPEARYMRVTCAKEGWDWDSNVVGGKQPKDA